MDKTKAKIQELCPDMMDGHWCECSYHAFEEEHEKRINRITLAVVLRAIKHQYMNEGVGGGYRNIQEHYGSICAMYDLEHDNYDQQSEECKEFIGSLLGV